MERISSKLNKRRIFEMSIKTLLEKEINDEFEELGKTAIGSDEYKTTVDGLTKLMDRAIELEKSEAERADRKAAQESELELKAQQLEDEKKDRKVKNWLTAAGIIIPTGVTIWGTIKSIKFEQEGTITTIMGRGFINKLLPKK
jgi:hypothetical protein